MMFLITFMLLFEVVPFAEGRKFYLRVRHTDHFAVDEFNQQEYVQLEPDGRLKRELDDYFETHKTSFQDYDDDDYNDDNSESSRDQTTVSGVTTESATIQPTRPEGSDEVKPWHAPLTDKIKHVKQYLSKKLYADVLPTEEKNTKNITRKSDEYRLIIDGNERPETIQTEDLIDHKYARVKRAANTKYVDANQGWTVKYSTTTKTSTTGPLDAVKITKEDIRTGEKKKIKFIFEMIFVTLGVVLLVSILALCFVKDPKTFCIAFGSGCPCILFLCPCLVKCLEKFLDPGKLIQDAMNTYMPGVIVHEDGKIENYKVTPEEIDCLLEIMDEMVN